MAHLVKIFDTNLKEYKRLKSSIRHVLKHGITDKNSYNFYINLDRINELIPKLIQRYNMTIPTDILDALDAYG